MLWLWACVFNLNVWPPTSQKKECFSLRFLSLSSFSVTTSSDLSRKEKKKRSCELAATFCQHTEAETHESERGSRAEHKVFLHERQRIPTRACWQATKPHSSLAWAVDHNKPRDEPFILGAAERSTLLCGLSQYLTVRRFYLLRHPRLLPSTRCKWSMREVASCILFKKRMITHPNRQQGGWFKSIRPFANSAAFKNTNYAFTTWFSHLTWENSSENI